MRLLVFSLQAVQHCMSFHPKPMLNSGVSDEQAVQLCCYFFVKPSSTDTEAHNYSRPTAEGVRPGSRAARAALPERKRLARLQIG